VCVCVFYKSSDVPKVCLPMSVCMSVCICVVIVFVQVDNRPLHVTLRYVVCFLSPV